LRYAVATPKLERLDADVLLQLAIGFGPTHEYWHWYELPLESGLVGEQDERVAKAEVTTVLQF
jgi:hypothetical protein